MDRYEERLRIGKIISSIRESKGLTQEELAELTGFTKGTIIRIELGKFGVRIDVLATIAKALGKRVELV